jgi:hypothetical protein
LLARNSRREGGEIFLEGKGELCTSLVLMPLLMVILTRALYSPLDDWSPAPPKTVQRSNKQTIVGRLPTDFIIMHYTITSECVGCYGTPKNPLTYSR